MPRKKKLTFENKLFQADTMRKKGTRVEDENESLMMQLKKMATKARSMPLKRMCMIFFF